MTVLWYAKAVTLKQLLLVIWLSIHRKWPTLEQNSMASQKPNSLSRLRSCLAIYDNNFMTNHVDVLSTQILCTYYDENLLKQDFDGQFMGNPHQKWAPVGDLILARWHQTFSGQVNQVRTIKTPNKGKTDKYLIMCDVQQTNKLIPKGDTFHNQLTPDMTGEI